MAGGGNYPIMSDLEWANAPWNQQETQYDICPECNGDGGIWFDDDGNVFTSLQVDKMSDEVKSLLTFEKCERCNGDGKIEIEPYEPDWDDYDD